MLNTYYMLSPVLDTGATKINKTLSLSLRQVQSSGAQRLAQRASQGSETGAVTDVHAKQGHRARKREVREGLPEQGMQACPQAGRNLAKLVTGHRQGEGSSENWVV